MKLFVLVHLSYIVIIVARRAKAVQTRPRLGRSLANLHHRPEALEGGADTQLHPMQQSHYNLQHFTIITGM